MQKSIILFFVFVILSGIAMGQVPQLINYQGILIDPGTGDPVPDDTYEMVFSIYDVASGGSAIWSETKNVQTQNGLYSVLLGSTTPLTTTILSGTEKYLGIKVGTDPEMTPRKRIVSVAYALTTAAVSGASNIFPSDGDVGIGTTSPAEKLDVSGTVQMTGFKLTTGINDGYVLTSDGNGVGTWQPTSGGLTLPYSGSTSSSSTAFGITNIGTGNAGSFNINNSSSSGWGLNVSTNGLGHIAHFSGDNPNSDAVGVMVQYHGIHDALQVQGYGPGNVGVFDVMSASSGGTAVQGGTIGTGSAASFSIGNSNNSNHTLIATTDGLGRAGNFEIRNTNNTAAALYTLTDGTGPGLRVDHAGASGYIAQFEDVGDVKVNIDKSGTVEMQGFKMPGGSSNGYVLTSDDTGIGTWQPAPGGFALPYSGTVSSSSTAFEVINTGTGLAGQFTVDNPDNNGGSLVIHYNGYEHPALAVTSFGASSACIFDITDASNTSDALWAYTNGLGSACNFRIENVDNGATVLKATTIGTGRAANFSIDNSNNSSTALNVYTNGTGRAGQFTNGNPNSSAGVVGIEYNGSSDGEPALGVYHNGSANNACVMDITSTGNNYDGLAVYTNGGGRAAYFKINGSDNSSQAILSSTNGTGVAGEFKIENPANANAALHTSTDGTGTGLSVNHTGASGNIAEFRNLGETKVNIDKSGMVQMTGFRMPNSATDGYVLTSDADGNGSWQPTSGGLTLPYSGSSSSSVANDVVFDITSTGGYGTARFAIDNTSNDLNAITASTNGLGHAGRFSVENNSSDITAFLILNDGLGTGLEIQNQNTSSSSAGLHVSSSGTGPAISAGGKVEMTGFRLSSSPVEGYVLTSDSDGNGTWQPASGGSDGDWTISGSDMYSAVPGKVGIGISTPSAKLTINDVGDSDNHGESAIYIADAGNQCFDYNDGLVFRSDGDGWATRFTATSDMVSDGEILGIYKAESTPGEVRHDNGDIIAIFRNDGNIGIGNTDPTASLDITGSTGYNQLRLRASYTPTGTSDTNGEVGDIAWDENYFYIKTSAGWKRAALSTW